MSQDEKSNTSEPAIGSQDTGRRSPAGAWQTMGQGEPVVSSPVLEPMEAHGTADAPTIGTGTSIALGCVAGTILLIVIGLIYILIAALL